MSTATAGSARDGRYQQRRHWPCDEPVARALLLHGLNEHSGRYEHVGAALAEARIEVHAHDHRGHGRTWGHRSYLDDFSEFLDDVEDHLADVRALEPGCPVVLIGHSMGGLIAHTYCVDGRPLPDLLVSSGAALAPIGVPEWQKRLAKVMARFAPKLRVGGSFDAEILSRDPAVVTAYDEDPLVPKGITASLGQAMMTGMSQHAGAVDRLSIPTLALHGGADELVKPEATEMLEALESVERRVLPDMRHEIFNEIGHEDLLAEVIAWIHARVDDLA